MDLKPQIFTAEVMHKRIFPRVNQFKYKVYYLALPVEQLRKTSHFASVAINHFSAVSFHEKDHGSMDEQSNEVWIQHLLKEHGLSDVIKHVMLVSMPRILYYQFNPVSFWICLDEDQNIRAVLSEVHNTFGEHHSYLCKKEDLSPIESNDWLHAEKLFHVSPFLEREGSYAFRFSYKNDKLGVWIDYFDSKGNLQLMTSLVGKLHPLTKRTIRKVFWSHPLVTLKTILLIHWQAAKLVFKRIKYISKPQQKEEKLSVNHHVN